MPPGITCFVAELGGIILNFPIPWFLFPHGPPLPCFSIPSDPCTAGFPIIVLSPFYCVILDRLELITGGTDTYFSML